MGPSTAECVDFELQRAELRSILSSQLFIRSQTLSRLLSYLCEKAFAGETNQLKEYSIAVDVFGRGESFDQDSDSIVRVEVNRLRKRLDEYYRSEGSGHSLRLVIPVGQYVPTFQSVRLQDKPSLAEQTGSLSVSAVAHAHRKTSWYVWVAIAALLFVGIAVLWRLLQTNEEGSKEARDPQYSGSIQGPIAGHGTADEVRILAGSTRNYVDHSGKLWSPDAYYSGGNAIRSAVQRIWRTQDAAIYRTSRQGDFAYDIPLRPGIYELRLHFAENQYGPEEATGGGEGSRVMTVTANGRVLLSGFDVLADSGAGRTADVRVFTDISPANDGFLHLRFNSVAGTAMVSGIEILPGVHGRVRPIRIVTRDLPYYSNDSQWWSADVYFKGGQLGGSLEPAKGIGDPELYETERWGNFSYAIPAAPGKYRVTLHFIEHRVSVTPASDGTSDSTSANEPRIFDVFCNGKRVAANLNLREEVGENRPLVRPLMNIEPNAQGKIVLQFVPVSHYATVSAIEVLPQ
jgi:hypothetical protein